MSITTPKRTRRLTATAFAILAAIAVIPVTAATAATYVPDAGDVTVINPGGSGEQHLILIDNGMFDGGSSVLFQVDGPGLAVLSVFHAATAQITKQASAAGGVSVSVDVPDNAPGNYTVSIAGTRNGEAVLASTTITAVSDGTGEVELPAPDGDGLAETGGPDEAATPNVPVDPNVPVVPNGPVAPNVPVAQAATINGNAVTGPVVVGYPANSFLAGESVIFSVTGSETATLSAVRAATVSFTKTADAAGAVSVTVALPANATGNYVVTAKGATSGFTQAPVTLGDKTLASTGFDVPMLLIWGAAGVLLLGLALIVVQKSVRRRATSVAAR